MGKVIDIFPANKFRVACDNAAREIDVGIIIGYDSEGKLCVYAGGVLDGRQPVCKDWLWMVEAFKTKMMAGHYDDK